MTRCVPLFLVCLLFGCQPQASDPAAQKAAIGSAAQEYLQKRTPERRLNVVVDRIEGDYARMHVIPAKSGGTAGIGFARREGPAWKVLAIAPAFDAAFYQRAGIPVGLQAP